MGGHNQVLPSFLKYQLLILDGAKPQNITYIEQNYRLITQKTTAFEKKKKKTNKTKAVIRDIEENPLNANKKMTLNRKWG